MRVRWAALVAVVGGFAGAGAFPRLGIWPLMFISVAALSYAVDGRRARTGAWLGYLYGLAFLLPLLHWTGVYVGPVPWLILAAAEAAFFALLGTLLVLVQRRPFAPMWIGAAWVLQEFLRDRLPFGGFPWGRLAFSQATSPLKWFAALGGAPLVSFAVALAGGALAVAARGLRELRWAAATASVFVLALILAVPLHVGRTDGGTPLRIALIQGNVPSEGLENETRAREVLDYHVAQTMRLVADIKAGRAQRPDLVLWPENASDVDPFADPTAYQLIDETVRAVGAPILVGAILQAPHGDRYNVGILWSPTSGPGARYTKRHPVPFGEYIPLRSIATWVSSDANLVTDMLAGHGNGLLKGGPVPIGDVICFEVAYDSLVQSSIKAGAQVLVVQTNNATFGHTSETYQQLAMSRLRAVETGRTVMQVATTGKSAVIDPDGRIVAQSGALYTAATLTADVAPRTAKTLAVRLGAWPEYVLSAFAVLAAACSIGLSLRQRRRRTPDPSPTPGQSEEMVTT